MNKQKYTYNALGFKMKIIFLNEMSKCEEILKELGYCKETKDIQNNWKYLRASLELNDLFNKQTIIELDK